MYSQGKAKLAAGEWKLTPPQSPFIFPDCNKTKKLRYHNGGFLVGQWTITGLRVMKFVGFASISALQGFRP